MGYGRLSEEGSTLSASKSFFEQEKSGTLKRESPRCPVSGSFQCQMSTAILSPHCLSCLTLTAALDLNKTLRRLVAGKSGMLALTNFKQRNRRLLPHTSRRKPSMVGWFHITIWQSFKERKKFAANQQSNSRRPFTKDKLHSFCHGQSEILSSILITPDPNMRNIEDICYDVNVADTCCTGTQNEGCLCVCTQHPA